MKKSLLLGLMLLAFSRCGSGDHALQKTPSANPAAGKILRGSLQMNASTAVLSDCETGKQYHVQITASLDSLYRQACGPIAYPEKTVYAVLRGNFSGDILAVNDVDAMEAKNAWNTCIPFEFWCSGTEPFWDLEISQAEGGFFYQDAAREQGAKYAWSAPQVEGDTWIYTASATPARLPALRIKIKKEPANNGMSELSYNYSAELSVNGEKRRGVAIRWGEPKLEPKK